MRSRSDRFIDGLADELDKRMGPNSISAAVRAAIKQADSLKFAFYLLNYEANGGTCRMTELVNEEDSPELFADGEPPDTITVAQLARNERSLVLHRLLGRYVRSEDEALGVVMTKWTAPAQHA